MWVYIQYVCFLVCIFKMHFYCRRCRCTHRKVRDRIVQKLKATQGCISIEQIIIVGHSHSAILFSNNNEQTIATAIAWMRYYQKCWDEFTDKCKIGPYPHGSYQMHHHQTQFLFPWTRIIASSSVICKLAQTVKGGDGPKGCARQDT